MKPVRYDPQSIKSRIYTDEMEADRQKRWETMLRTTRAWIKQRNL